MGRCDAKFGNTCKEKKKLKSKTSIQSPRSLFNINMIGL